MICCTAISFFPVCVCFYVFSLPQMCIMAELFATFWTHVWLLSSVRLNVSPENTLQPNVLLHCAHILPFCVNSHTVGSVIITLESVRVWKSEKLKVWECGSVKVLESESIRVCECECESLKVWWPLFLLVDLKKSCTNCTSEAFPLCVT